MQEFLNQLFHIKVVGPVMNWPGALWFSFKLISPYLVLFAVALGFFQDVILPKLPPNIQEWVKNEFS